MVTVSLTDAERLLLWRRRERLTQAKAARKLKVPLDTYLRWEYEMDYPSAAGKVPRMPLGKLTDPEVCLLLRRRKGMSQQGVAERLGVCRWTLNKMERGLVPAEALLAFWKNSLTQLRKQKAKK